MTYNIRAYESKSRSIKYLQSTIFFEYGIEYTHADMSRLFFLNVPPYGIGHFLQCSSRTIIIASDPRLSGKRHVTRPNSFLWNLYLQFFISYGFSSLTIFSFLIAFYRFYYQTFTILKYTDASLRYFSRSIALSSGMAL